MKSINSEEFFKQVALNAGIVDLQTVKNIYYGMVRTISKELKGKQVVDLPDWGKFVLTTRKSRKALNVSSGNVEILPPKLEIRFKADYKVKKYFQEWSKQ